MKYFVEDVLCTLLEDEMQGIQTESRGSTYGRRDYGSLSVTTSFAAFYSSLLQALCRIFCASVDKVGGGNINVIEAEDTGYTTRLNADILNIVTLYNTLINFTKNTAATYVTHQVSFVKLFPFASLINVSITIIIKVLAAALREGRSFIESFLKRSKVLHIMFGLNRSAVLKFLGILQKVRLAPCLLCICFCL